MSTSGRDLDFRVLGPLEVRRADTPLPPGPAQRRALLALLLVHAREVVTVDRILEELWHGDPPSSAEHAIQVHVSGLRKVLDPQRSNTDGLLRRSGNGYVLAVPGDCYDRDRFEAQVAAGRTAFADGRADQAAQILTEAEAAWRGPAFADLVGEQFVVAEAARLDELRLVATETRFAAELALGRHAELAAPLERLLAAHPFRETLWSHLILALYRSGRQADALGAYQRLRDTLDAELGLKPSPPLRDLQTAILRHDRALDPPSSRPTPAAAPSAPLPLASSLPRGERADAVLDETGPGVPEMRVVTALFVDLVGSTALAELLDPEEYTLVVNGAVERMTAGVEAIGGEVASRMGDGILAVFGADAAHEDDPERAVRAALRIVADIAAYGAEVAASWGVDPPTARAGLDTGPVLVSAGSGDQLLGDVINTAARLQAAAPVGGVLCGTAVRGVTEPLFDWGASAEYDLKGKAEPVVAAQVLAVRAAPGSLRGLAGRHCPVVGRDAEILAAHRMLDALMAGNGGVLVISGEPGTGKSRLLGELRARFAETAPDGLRSTWLEGRCVSWGESIAYGPFREMLREWLALPPSCAPLRANVTLRRTLDGLFGAEHAEAGQFLGSLLGLPTDGPSSALPPESLRHGIFEAVRTLLRRLADEGPVVVTVDDLHWADATSLGLLESLLGTTEHAAILVIAVMRPEHGHGSWTVRETALRDCARRARELALEPLDEVAAAHMLDALTQVGLPPATTADLLAAAEGNPLFIEELVRSMLDSGALYSTATGWAFDPNVAVAIPRSVETVLGARIDRLPASTRAVLGVAAVLGRQFERNLLDEVAEPDTEVAAAVEQLVHVGLLEQARRWPSLEFRFRHVLGQEAAYRRLTTERRRSLHRRAAEVTEAFLDGPGSPYQAVVARHRERAGQPERALAHYRFAGDAAQAAHALDEAVRHYSAALDATATLAADDAGALRPPLHLGRGHVWYQQADERAGTELRLALDQARAVGDTATELRALEDLYLCEGLMEGRRADGTARLTEALALADRIGDSAAGVAIRNRRTVEFVNSLDLCAALPAGEQALAAAEAAGDEVLVARAMDGLKLVALVLGDFARLRELSVTLEEVLRRHDQRWYLMFTLAESSFAWAATGDWSEATRRLEEARRINVEMGDRMNAAYPLTLRAWVERERGDLDEALTWAREAMESARAARNTQMIAWSGATLGTVLSELGDLDQAATELTQARVAAERGVPIELVRIQSQLAVVRARAGDPAAPEDLARAERMLAEVRTPPGTMFLHGLDSYLAVAECRGLSGDQDGATGLVAPLLAACETAGWVGGIARCAAALARHRLGPLSRGRSVR